MNGFILTLLLMQVLYTQAVLIQILINVQYLHVAFSFDFKVLKRFERSKSLMRFPPSNKNFPSKTSHGPATPLCYLESPALPRKM